MPGLGTDSNMTSTTQWHSLYMKDSAVWAFGKVRGHLCGFYNTIQVAISAGSAGVNGSLKPVSKHYL